MKKLFRFVQECRERWDESAWKDSVAKVKYEADRDAKNCNAETDIVDDTHYGDGWEG